MNLTKKTALYGAATLVGLGLAAGSAMAATTVVTPSNFTASGWSAQDIQAGGTAQISTDNPRSGAGSVDLSAPSDGAKATLFHTGGDGLTLGDFDSTTGGTGQLGFDYFRDSSSTASNVDAPAYRLYVGSYSTQLVWETSYNGTTGANPVPTDSWQTVNIGNQLFWERTGGTNYNTAAGAHTLSYWATQLGSTTPIVDYSVGVGSGWGGSYAGNVDNVVYGSNTTNFEPDAAPVPEPASWAAFAFMGLGAAALMFKARKRKALEA